MNEQQQENECVRTTRAAFCVLHCGGVGGRNDGRCEGAAGYPHLAWRRCRLAFMMILPRHAEVALLRHATAQAMSNAGYGHRTTVAGKAVCVNCFSRAAMVTRHGLANLRPTVAREVGCGKAGSNKFSHAHQV